MYVMMERGKKNVLDDGLGRDLMNAGRFCFSCEQIFANRKCLEDHFCPAVSFICSCGTEFAEYRDMLEHSTTHEPGHQVLDHGTIRKRRIEKHIEEEEKLHRLQTGEVVWKSTKMNNVPSMSVQKKPMLQASISSARMPQVPMQSAQISQVPQMYHPKSKAPLHPNPIHSEKDMQNIFAGVGAPTVDLWTLYQPVVLVQTVRHFSKTKPYTCGKCGLGFTSKTSLISHHSTHVTDKVSGCIGCGLLLSSKKMVPRFHVCKAPNTATKLRIITAKPLRMPMPIAAITARNPSVQWPRATSSPQLKKQNPSAASKGSRALMTSSQQWKNQKIQTYNKSNQGFRVSPSLQVKSQNPGAAMKSRYPTIPSMQLKTPTKPASVVWGKTTQASSASNGFPCRVCHLPFDTAQLLQRHKCVKAREFMAQHLRGGKQHFKLKSVTPMASPSPAQLNGEIKRGVPASGNINKGHVMAVGLDKGQGAVPVNGITGVDADDDCYIVESGPDKPAEMIYQVTSSVPIKT
ncbi:uncharacterized protein LOC131975735 [Centropristis striata]|uniref:uncharacterized protein LOC131975735 n=1 Tax=Centropristis striata TaxID=184440 RepID=UPI0027E19139|nr:uncharacterized protein LOC131975735 [Centropristis striata]